MLESVNRILVVIDGLPVGGAEKMLVNLVNRLDKSRFQVTVTPLSRTNPLASAIAPEIQVIALPRRWRYDLNPVRQLQRLIEERKIDVVLCFSLYSFFFARLAVGMFRQSPAVFVSIHSGQLFSLRRYLQHVLYARLLNGSERFIAVCNAQADYWAKAYFIPRSRFVTVYNGVDVQFFKPADDLKGRLALRTQWQIPAEAFVIVQVANLAPYKRHEDALLALRYLLDAAPGCSAYLVLVGGGVPEREIKLRNMAEALKLSERVVFCGMQSDVRPFYSAADIFTLTSARENFSVAALEAMAMGLPCVITDISGAREMITDGVNGYVSPPLKPRDMAERWLLCFNHSGRFDRSAIRQRVCEQFDIECCVQRYAAIIISTAKS
jgi:glycosyltransferase involved in cell wall biosynthesis